VLPDHEVISCNDYDSHVTMSGLLYNNVWNKHASKASDSHQCIIKQQLGDITQHGWLWNWPTSPRTTFAQPQIKIGSSPWDPSPAFGQDLPRKIDTLVSLDLAHELEIVANGNFNVATTMWLINQSEPSENSIVAELMIWSYYTEGQFKPGGRKVDSFVQDGLEWELWEQQDWDDKSGVNQQQWRYLAFRLVQPSLKVDFDVKALIERAIERGSVDEQWYIADLELGTELMGGQGLAWIKQFEVRIVR